MSAYVSLVRQEACHLFTDGAMCNPTNISLLAVISKAITSRKGHLAVTTRGDVDLGHQVALEICELADRYDPSVVLEMLQSYAHGLGEQLGVMEDTSSLDVLVTTWIPGVGGAHRIFRSYAPTEQIGAYEVFTPSSSVWSGPKLGGHECANLGLLRQPGEPDCVHALRFGLGIISTMRFRKVKYPNGDEHYIVGGKCDYTLITATGAQTTTMIEWPDEPGEGLDPFRAMTPSERRRLEAIFTPQGHNK